MADGPDPRLAALSADLARRLRSACVNIPEADFQTLVADIAEMKLRCGDAPTAPVPERLDFRRLTERLRNQSPPGP